MTTLTRSRSFAAPLLAGAAIAVAAFAGTMITSDADAASVRAACKADYKRFCPQYDPDSAQARSCMQQAGRRRSLSPRCVDALIDAGYVPKKYRKRS